MTRWTWTRALVVAAAVGLAFAVFGLRDASARLVAEIIPDDDRFYLPPPSWLRAFSLGYNEAAADFIWVTTVIYFGERAEFSTKRSGETDIPKDAAAAQYTVNYLAVVTALDPRFRKAYADGARLTLYHRGRITRRTTGMAIDILRSGLDEFPDDGELAFSLGFLYYYELPPFLAPGSPEIKEAREMGARYIRRAATLPGAPGYVSTMSSALLRREGMDDLVIEHLRALLMQETAPNIRATLEAQLRRELGKAAERDIVATRRLERRWRAEMPFAPFDMFLMMQPEVPWDVREVIEPARIGLAPDADAEP